MENGQTFNGTTTKKISKNVIIVLSGLIVVLFLLVWCGFNHIQGGKYMEAGDYPAAIAAYQRNFLSGARQKKEAIRQAGEAAFESSDYQTAAEYFRQLGADGEARLADSLYERAKQLTAEGQPEEALVVLEEIAGEPRAQTEQAAAQLAIAQQLYEKGAYNEAIEAAEKIDRSLNENVPVFLNNVYHAIAGQKRMAGDYQAAVDAYNNCTNDPIAETNAELLSLLLAGDYCNAAVQANDVITSKETDLTRTDWMTIFGEIMRKPGSYDIEKFLPYWFAQSTIANRTELDPFAEFYNPAFPKAGDSYDFPSGSLIIPSLSDLYKQCGTAPQNKILVVVQLHDYPNRETYQAIVPESMEFIPSEYYPSSLDEVEYVVLISYDYTKVGTYGYTIGALQLNARVEVLKMPSQRQVFSSGTLWGEYPPQIIHYFVPPEWESGTAPEIGEKFYAALSSIIPAG